LPEIAAKVWVTSHHRGIYTDRQKFERDLLAFGAKIDEREQRLIALLKQAPRTLAQLVEIRLRYPPGFDAPWVIDAERRTISQHLDEMLRDGKIEVDEDGLYRHQ